MPHASIDFTDSIKQLATTECFNSNRLFNTHGIIGKFYIFLCNAKMSKKAVSKCFHGCCAVVVWQQFVVPVGNIRINHVVQHIISRYIPFCPVSRRNIRVNLIAPECKRIIGIAIKHHLNCQPLVLK